METTATPPAVKDGIRSFRVNLRLWARFGVAAKAHNRTRGAQLNVLLEEFTLGYEQGRSGS